MSQQIDRFDETFSRCYRSLVEWCKRRVPRNLGDPEDFVHMAYLKCRRSWLSNKSSDRGEIAYFYVAMRWTVLDAARHRSRRRANELKYVALRPRSVPDDQLQQMVGREAVERLPRRQQQVCLEIQDGRRPAEIQRNLKINSNSLAVFTSRAKARLIRDLD